MNRSAWSLVILAGLLPALLIASSGDANPTNKTDPAPDSPKTESDDPAPTQFQWGPFPPVDVGMAVSGSSQKFMRFDHIATKLQNAGRSIENGKDDQQVERDARLNRREKTLNIDPERAPSEGRANQQGHKALGVSLQTKF